MMNSRAVKGVAEFKRVLGEQGEDVLRSLADISPDLARLVVEYPFGDIYSRPGLDFRTRELVAVAALATLGNARPQLKMHIHGALNVGCTREEVLEVILQMSIFAGFPAALNSVSAAREVFEERKGEPAPER
jgi:4-carboxymuconolactone decarboxylase